MALQNFLDIDNISIEGASVFLRLDLNAPLKDGKVLDATRILAAMPTLDFLLEKNCKVVVGSHLGRPSKVEDPQALSLEPIAQYLNEEGYEVLLMDSPDSDAPLELVKNLKSKQIILLENLRFSDGEISNSQELAIKWSRYCDIYINDAFGCCHRAHASIDALPRLKTVRCYGPLVRRELKALDGLTDQPKGPFTLVVGGSKVSDKLPVVEAFIDRADYVIIGGAMAYTFMKAMDRDVGRSKVEHDKIDMAREFLKRMEAKGKTVVLPVDHAVVEKLGDTEFESTAGPSVPADKIAVDIGPKSVSLFSKVISESSTIFWNGPMGMYETPPFEKGSVGVAQAIADSGAYSVVGGGDSGAVIVQAGLQSEVSHLSTGGGASMAYLCGQALPGLEVLKVRTLA